MKAFLTVAVALLMGAFVFGHAGHSYAFPASKTLTTVEADAVTMDVRLVWDGRRLPCTRLPRFSSSTPFEARVHGCWNVCLVACTGSDLSCVGQCLSICPK
jgi:hypothetical protein